MRIIPLLGTLSLSLLLGAASWAQKPADHLAAALAKARPAAAVMADRAPQQTISRPGRGVRYDWNDATQAWSTAPDLETYFYDNRGNLTQEAFADSATARFTHRSLYPYDAQNRSTGELYQLWQNGAWTDDGRFVATYDAQGTPTQELEQQWRSGAWVTTNGSQYQNSYAGTVLTEQIELRWDSGVFRNHQRLLFTVANGQWADVVVQAWELGAWENNERYTDLVWHNWPAQQPASYREQDWQGTWEDDFRYALTYAPNGTVVQLEEQATGPGAWALTGRATDTFDSFGNDLGFRSESRQGSAWVLESEARNLLTYTAADDVRFRITQRFNRSGGSTAFENAERYNFSNFQRITLGTASAALAARAGLYPNPTAGTATLALAGLTRPGEVQLDVLNALGQHVFGRTARPTAGQLSEMLDLRGLPAGIYTVRAHTPEGTVTKRLVKE